MLNSMQVRRLMMAFVLAVSATFCQADSNPVCLWVLENQGSRVYLLGSIHAMKTGMYPLTSVIEEAFREADKVVFEVDLSKLAPGEINRVMRANGFYTGGRTIAADVSSNTLEMLKQYLRERDLAFSDFQRMKPWYLMLTIGQRELSLLGYESQYGIDHHFQQLAIAEGKPILELESFQDQIRILSGESMVLQELSLRASLEEQERLEQTLGKLVDAWTIGDANHMLALTMEAMNKYPQLHAQMDRLIDQRNLKMADKIREYASSRGTYLVVAGALHMGGDNGIISLLRKDFKVQQLSD